MLNIVFASDDNYAPFLTIAIFTLLEHNISEFDNINIFILDDNICKDNKTKIIDLTKKYPISVSFIKTKNLGEMGFNVLGLDRNLNQESSLTTYARLFMPTLIPKSVDKVLYLDCDGLIIDSFKNLWNLDISNYYCAGVIDAVNSAVKEKLGYNPEEYINAGFLLVNLKKWREDHVEEKFINFMTENQNKFYQHDQGIINNIFKGKIKIIDPKYNLQNHYQILTYNLAKKYTCTKNEYYTKEMIDNARENPTFLHFCGPNYDRPWYNKNHPYAETFKKYATKVNQTAIINYLTDLPLKPKIFYKATNNKFTRLILNMIPGVLVRSLVNKNALKQVDEENKKVKESFIKMNES